ncbi:hypothetical protein DUNSADRAFT_12266, partial [Dunaliella salina]
MGAIYSTAARTTTACEPSPLHPPHILQSSDSILPNVTQAPHMCERACTFDDLPDDVLTELICRVDDPADVRSFLRCNKRVLAHSADETVQAGWLVRHRRVNAIFLGYSEFKWKEPMVMRLIQGGLAPVDESALIWASKRGHYHVVKRLLTCMSPSCTTEKGHTPLQMASFHGHVDIVKELLSQGASC